MAEGHTDRMKDGQKKQHIGAGAFALPKIKEEENLFHG